MDLKVVKGPKYLVSMFEKILFGGHKEYCLVMRKGVFGVDPLDIIINKFGKETIERAEVSVFGNGYVLVLEGRNELEEVVSIKMFFSGGPVGKEIYEKILITAKRELVLDDKPVVASSPKKKKRRKSVNQESADVSTA